MTRDDIIRMAREACEVAPRDDWNSTAWVLGDDGLEHFASLVAAAEREACAKVLDEMADQMAADMEPSTAIAWVHNRAAAIRARGEKT